MANRWLRHHGPTSPSRSSPLNEPPSSSTIATLSGTLGKTRIQTRQHEQKGSLVNGIYSHRARLCRMRAGSVRRVRGPFRSGFGSAKTRFEALRLQGCRGTLNNLPQKPGTHRHTLGRVASCCSCCRCVHDMKHDLPCGVTDDPTPPDEITVFDAFENCISYIQRYRRQRPALSSDRNKLPYGTISAVMARNHPSVVSPFMVAKPISTTM
jgi:hypothetical protein